MANVVSKDASRVSANGWRQGSVLSQSLVTTLIRDHQIPGITLEDCIFEQVHEFCFGRNGLRTPSGG